MSFNNFIPTVWSTKLEKDLEKDLVFAPNTNRKHEGEVAEKGDSVKILGIERPTITTDSSTGKTPAVPTVEEGKTNSQFLTFNTTASFNFMVKDLDKAQSAPTGIITDLTAEARRGIAEEMDKKIANLANDDNVTKKASAQLTTSNILNALDFAKQKLWENNVPVGEHITAFMPPWMTIMLNQAYINLNTNNPDYMKNGNVGRYGGMEAKMTNNLYNDGTDYYVIVMTNKAIAFANPFTFVEPYRHQDYFSDAVRGFTLYDAKVVRAKEIYVLKVHA